jgi:threonine efflux protein
VNAWATLLTIAGVHALGLLVPGPNVVAVTHTALTRSRRAGVAVALGVAIGALVWSSAASFGLAAVLAHATGLETGLRLAGAAFLIWIGVRHLLARDRPAETDSTATAAGASGSLVARGLLVNLTNPKSLLFFAGVFAALVPAHAPLWLRGAAVGVVVVDSLVWHTTLAVVFSTRPFARAARRTGTAVRRVVGGVFVAFGVRLAFGGL